jgi:MFS transporter, DHA1 family, multidrug resistance protein
MVLNGKVVERIGTRRLAHGVLLCYLVAASALVAMAVATDGRPPLWMFLIGIAAMLVSHALLIPNFNTIAMTPMGAIAGTAASVIGATQIAVGALLGALLDRTFDGSILPLSFGFLGYGLLAFGLVLFAERGELFERLHPPPAAEELAEALADHEVV